MKNSESWDIDPKTGDYLQSNGAPVPTNSLRVPAYYRLKTKRKKWLYAPDDDFGSDLYLVQKGGINSVKISEDMCARALQPLADDDRAAAIQIQATKFVRGALALDIKLVDNAGKVETLEFVPVTA